MRVRSGPTAASKPRPTSSQFEKRLPSTLMDPPSKSSCSVHDTLTLLQLVVSTDACAACSPSATPATASRTATVAAGKVFMALSSHDPRLLRRARSAADILLVLADSGVG